MEHLFYNCHGEWLWIAQGLAAIPIFGVWVRAMFRKPARAHARLHQHTPRMSEGYPKTGLVFTGWRHSDCYVTLNAWAERLTQEEQDDIGEEVLQGRYQGFLTSTGRFVRRPEAARIAFRAGQISYKASGLTSEMLY